MKIGIVGCGLVGGTLQYGFRRLGHEVVVHDTKLGTHLRDVLSTDLVFVCVPTPSAPDGTCDTTIVESVVRDLEFRNYGGVVVVKSTVSPGTMDRLHMTYAVAMAYCPEFLREKCSYSDFVDHHDICIIGSYRYTDFEKIRMAHGHFPKKLARVTPLEAEFCKYFSNVFNALRINFANQFYDVCKEVGADYAAIKQAISHRESIGGHYLDCSPFFRGFGGSCLPKDTLAFAKYVEQRGIKAPIFQSIVRDNERYV